MVMLMYPEQLHIAPDGGLDVIDFSGIRSAQGTTMTTIATTPKAAKAIQISS
jgi:hypothetical protein